MKRWSWLLVVLVAFFAGRTEIGTDVGKLEPVQVVRLSETNGQVKVETDTGEWGVGADVEAALAALHGSADAEVTLDTAEYLLLATEDEETVLALAERLRPSCVLCSGGRQTELEGLGTFLQIHRPTLTLMRYRAGDRDIQTVLDADGRLELVP